MVSSRRLDISQYLATTYGYEIHINWKRILAKSRAFEASERSIAVSMPTNGISWRERSQCMRVPTVDIILSKSTGMRSRKESPELSHQPHVTRMLTRSRNARVSACAVKWWHL